MKADKISFSFLNSSWIVGKKKGIYCYCVSDGPAGLDGWTWHCSRHLFDSCFLFVLVLYKSPIVVHPAMDGANTENKKRKRNKARKENETTERWGIGHDGKSNILWLSIPSSMKPSEEGLPPMLLDVVSVLVYTHSHAPCFHPVRYTVYLNILKEWNERRRRRRRLNENLFALIPF